MYVAPNFKLSRYNYITATEKKQNTILLKLFLVEIINILQKIQPIPDFQINIILTDDFRTNFTGGSFS